MATASIIPTTIPPQSIGLLPEYCVRGLDVRSPETLLQQEQADRPWLIGGPAATACRSWLI